ncbi:MAG: hypothetical protein ABI564_18070 [Ideonella sp.]
MPADSPAPGGKFQLTTGRPWPLGAHRSGDGVNFAVFSAHAQAIELCLFDSSGVTQIGRQPLPMRSGDIWHGFLPTAPPGLIYGLRASGPWCPGSFVYHVSTIRHPTQGQCGVARHPRDITRLSTSGET